MTIKLAASTLAAVLLLIAPATARPPMIVTVAPGQTIHTQTPESYAPEDVVHTWTFVGKKRGLQEQRTRCSIFHYASGTVVRLLGGGCSGGPEGNAPLDVRVTNTSSVVKKVRIYRLVAPREGGRHA